MLAIKLMRTGAKKSPSYRVVVKEKQSKRDGAYLENLGTYNPTRNPAEIKLNLTRVNYWIEKGAQPTDTVRRILSFKGVLYLKHLLRGVDLGLFDQATAMEKFTKWSAEHDAQIKKRQDEAQRNRRARRPMPGRRPERRSESGG